MSNKFYLNTTKKLLLCISLAISWFLFSFYLTFPWIQDLSEIYNPIWAYCLVFGIALIPGFFNAFLSGALFFDKRPVIKEIIDYPNISILVAAYNEEENINDTLTSIFKQDYPAQVEVIVCDDGSIDKTAELVASYSEHIPENYSKKLLTGLPNAGKSEALNRGLKETSYDLILTIDADSYLYKDALKNLVGNYLSGPKNTAAVAGTVLVRNSRKNWLTKLQEWEYFISLSLVKRSQSLFQGTLVAQGAFSLYTKEVLNKLNGWKNLVGEDIVLTWGIQELGYRVGHAENAIIFTNVPEKYSIFFNQRRRWSRGLIEAFKQYPKVIYRIKLNTIFVWLNLMFPFLDFMFLFGFVPGLILALIFHWYAIVGILTLVLLPMAITVNYLIYRKHIKTFEELGLTVRKNYIGYVLFVLFNQLIMTPACLRGYTDEFLKLKKSWGTKEIKNKKRNTVFNKFCYFIITSVLINILLLFPVLVFADINGKYDYIYDNSYYEAHQEISKLEKNTFGLEQTYFIAHDHDLTYKYNTGFILKTFQYDRFKLSVGPGVLSTSDITDKIQPLYKINLLSKINDKGNIEFNAERSSQMNTKGDINSITNNIMDVYSLTGDYQIKKLSLVAGVFKNDISDGNSKNGLLFKEVYDINDNWLIQAKHKLYWFDYSSHEYFSPKQYQQHWLILSYIKPFLDESVVLKISAGPGFTKINDNQSITRIYEVSLKTNINGIKPELHYTCYTSVNNYENCSIGTSINIPL